MSERSTSSARLRGILRLVVGALLLFVPGCGSSRLAAKPEMQTLALTQAYLRAIWVPNQSNA